MRTNFKSFATFLIFLVLVLTDSRVQSYPTINIEKSPTATIHIPQLHWC